MKRIFIFPTVGEAKAFILSQPHDPVFVAGRGMAEIAAATVRAVKARKPELVVLAGFAAACDRRLTPGDVMEVVTDRMAAGGDTYQTSGPDLGLPLAAGVTDWRREAEEAPPVRTETGTEDGTPHAAQAPDTAGTAADATAASGAGPEKETGADTAEAETELPLVETAEGAVFFAVCEALGTKCCQIRAVVRHVGESSDEPGTEMAAERLKETLIQIFGNHEK